MLSYETFNKFDMTTIDTTFQLHHQEFSKFQPNMNDHARPDFFIIIIVEKANTLRCNSSNKLISLFRVNMQRKNL